MNEHITLHKAAKKRVDKLSGIIVKGNYPLGLNNKNHRFDAPPPSGWYLKTMKKQIERILKQRLIYKESRFFPLPSQNLLFAFLED
jgi:hypothetical protein